MDTQQRATRIASLEQDLVDVERELIALHQGRDIEEPRQPPPPLPPPPPTAHREPHEPEPHPGPDFARVEWLLRVAGIGLVVLAAVFFVSTAISRGWIGPTAQLTLATVTSIGFTAQSFRFALDKRPWRITFAGGGLSALFASGVVGYTGLDLLSFPAAFAWLSMCSLGFLVFSRLHDSQLLAWMSAPAVLIGAGLVHIIHDGGFTLPAVLGAAYATALAFTTFHRDWSIARLTGIALAASLGFLGVFVGVLEEVDAVTLTTAAILVIAGVGTAVLHQAIDYYENDDRALMMSARSFETRVMAAFIPWTATILALVASSLDSSFSSHPGVVFALVGVVGGTATLARSSIHPTVTLLHQVAAIGTISIGAAIELEGPALLVVLAVNAAVSAVLATRTRSTEMTIVSALLVAFTFVGFAAFTMMGAFEAPISLGESFATAVVLAGVLIGSVVLYEDEGSEGAWILALISSLAWILAHRLALPQGDMIVSLGWATVGAGLVVGGARLGDRLIIQAGLLTLVATTAKLFVIDLASVDVLWRAGLFFVIGGMFLRLGFLVPKLLGDPDSDSESDDASLA